MEIDKDLPYISKLIEENTLIKIIAPTGSGKSTNLPKHLGKKYNVVVVVSEKNIADSLNKLKFPNVFYTTSKEYKTFGKYDLIILENMNTFEDFLILSFWKNNKKIVLATSSKKNLLSGFPTYIVESYFNAPTEIRYSEDNLINLIYKTHNSTIQGDFLVFVLDIDSTVKKLKELNMEADIFSPSNYQFKKSDKRKIIVSDKVSVVLKNIGCIFDSMKEKTDYVTLTGGYRKKVNYISKTDADARANKGINYNKSKIVYRMISEKIYETLPETKEVFNKPLHHLMIDLYEENLNPFEILFNYNRKEIENMFNLFVKYGLLDVSSKLTQKARTIRKLNLGLKPSLIIVESGAGLEYESAVLACLIDNFSETPPYLFTKGIDKNKPVFEYVLNYNEHIKKHFNRFRGKSDVETLLYIWQSYLEEGKKLKDWTNENFIDYTYLKNVKKSLDKLNLKEKRFNVKEFISKIDDVIKYIYDSVLNLVFNQTVFTQYEDTNTRYKIDSFAINLIEEERPKEIRAMISTYIPESDIHSVSLSYVSPSVEIQSKNKEEIVF
jgi:HrpA-like RNA helicase